MTLFQMMLLTFLQRLTVLCPLYNHGVVSFRLQNCFKVPGAVLIHRLAFEMFDEFRHWLGILSVTAGPFQALQLCRFKVSNGLKRGTVISI